jgi:hypothetical protein
MKSSLQFFSRTYNRKGIIQLLMVCAFPIHVWAIIMAFRDFSWVAERTNTWDAIGLFSYAVVFAFVETLGVFLIVLFVGFFTPRQWDPEKRLAVLGTLFLMLAIWAVLGQIYSMNGCSLPSWIIDFLVRSDHPFRLLWGGSFVLVAASVTAAGLLVGVTDYGRRATLEIFDRISMLTSLYMVFDLAGIIVLVVRNIRF